MSSTLCPKFNYFYELLNCIKLILLILLIFHIFHFFHFIIRESIIKYKSYFYSIFYLFFIILLLL